MKKKKLAIFDLDGTLFDTGDVNYYAYLTALKDYNITLNEQFYKTECNGKYYKQYLPLLSNQLTENDMELIHERKKSLYAQNLCKAKANTHLFTIIENIKNEYYIALVTTASKKNADDILNYFHYYSLFELIITQENVVKTKPDPEGFIKAMEYFSVDKLKTIIFEDSQSGIIAAQRSGASVIKVISFT